MADDEYKQKLTPEQYHVLREKGTETPFSGKLLHNTETGEYACAACGARLFMSDDKYESDQPGLQGWPSFAKAVDDKTVKLEDDTSFGMQRIEVTCAACGSHLGHVFDDESSPTGQHYCINSIALDFMPKQ